MLLRSRVWISRNVQIYSRCAQSTAAVLEEPDRKETEYDNAKPFSDIPGPKGLPYLGTLLQYKTGRFSPAKFHHSLLERYKEYGPIYKETIAGRTVVHLMHPDYVQQVFGLEGKIPHIPPLLETIQMYRDIRDMSPGLGNTNGEEWYRLRTNVNQMMMRPTAVTQYLPQVNQVADDFLQRLLRVQARLKSHDVPNFANEIQKWTLESSTMTCFEKRLNCFDDEDDSTLTQTMLRMNANIFALSLVLKFNIPWFKLAPKLSQTWKELVECEDFFFSEAQRLVDETVEKIKKKVEAGELKEGEYAFMSYLLGKEGLSYKDASIISISLFVDGLSTTSPTFLGQLYCLAANPEKQERLREEVKRLTSDPRAPVTAAMINKASYLKACIKEGFRFFPIGTEVSRIPQKNIVIGGYQIPAGTHLELNQNMLLRMEEYFSEPDVYTPERWLRGEQQERAVHPYLMIPFGHGPRTCAGRRFAEQEMIVMIIKLLQNFRLEWPHNVPMEQRYNVLLKPDGPDSIRFVPRPL